MSGTYQEIDFISERIVNEFVAKSGFRFGSFTLKSGQQSSYYIDLRIIFSFPKLMDDVTALFCELMTLSLSSDEYELITGVPYAALPLATLISVKMNVPMIVKRKEAKAYGTKNLLEGSFSSGQSCLIIEDVVTTGSSIIETAQCLREHGLKVTHAIVFFDREQNGAENLAKANIKLIKVMTLSKFLYFIRKNSLIDSKELPIELSNVGLENPSKCQVQNLVPHSLRNQLFDLIKKKQSNLCLSADVSTSQQLLELAENYGSLICVLKIHWDIISNFTVSTASQLKEISTRHSFLLMEDRKLSDIGNICRLQFSNGPVPISSWAHLITVHCISGYGTLSALKQCLENRKDCGVVVVAEMSSVGNLISQSYTDKTLKLAREYSDIVCGLVGQSKLDTKSQFIQFTPGVAINKSNDALGQSYRSPEDAILEGGADVIIVGRGVLEAEDKLAAIEKYRSRGFGAFVKKYSFT